MEIWEAQELEDHDRVAWIPQGFTNRDAVEGTVRKALPYATIIAWDDDFFGDSYIQHRNPGIWQQIHLATERRIHAPLPSALANAITLERNRA